MEDIYTYVETRQCLADVAWSFMEYHAKEEMVVDQFLLGMGSHNLSMQLSLAERKKPEEKKPSHQGFKQGEGHSKILGSDPGSVFSKKLRISSFGANHLRIFRSYDILQVPILKHFVATIKTQTY